MNELERVPAAGDLNGALAAALPRLPGISFDGRHVAGNRRAPRPGGWHDALALPDGSVLISIGDLDGGDPAPLVARLRDRCVAAGNAFDPARLAEVAGALLDPSPVASPRAGVLVGLIDAERQTFTYTGIGYPSPRLRYTDGRVVSLPACTPRTDPDAVEPSTLVRVDLRGVGLLLLFTPALLPDGEPAGLGAPSIERLLADERITYSASPSAWLSRRMLDGRAHDAVEILAVLPASPARPPADLDLPQWSANWSFEATAASSNAVRRAFLACLASKPVKRPVDLGAAELIFGEMIGNVVRHAPGRVDIVLEWTTPLPVLHMKDNGPGFRSRRRRERLPVDDLSESGRGLFIINACAVDFSVRNRAGRGTHARATLALAP